MSNLATEIDYDNPYEQKPPPQLQCTWKVYVPLAGGPVDGLELCSCKSREALLAVIESLIRPDVTTTQSLTVRWFYV